MAELTEEERDFLDHHRVEEYQIFDASGMRQKDYREEMRELRRFVAYGVSACREYGHRLRSRAGHCVQCKPDSLSYLRRMEAGAFVYVATSKESDLVKVGSSANPEQRINTLRRESYGGVGDWVMIEKVFCSSAGRAEFEAHELLAAFSVTGLTYFKDWTRTSSREVFSCAPIVAVDCVRRAVTKFS